MRFPRRCVRCACSRRKRAHLEAFGTTSITQMSPSSSHQTTYRYRASAAKEYPRRPRRPSSLVSREIAPSARDSLQRSRSSRGPLMTPVVDGASIVGHPRGVRFMRTGGQRHRVPAVPGDAKQLAPLHERSTTARRVTSRSRRYPLSHGVVPLPSRQRPRWRSLPRAGRRRAISRPSTGDQLGNQSMAG